MPPDPLLPANVQRVRANNPGIMTGAGTNTYVVGDSALAVIDPGPDDPAHIDAILAAAAGRPIRWILVTHTHPDHWPAAPALADRTGALVLAYAARDGLEIDAPLADGDQLAAPGFTLRAVHTPGHASNHLCFLLVEAGLLFTGDHVMHGSTVVIWPPEGDVGTYLASLQRIVELQPTALAPGHGELFTEPDPVIRSIIGHRLAREAKVAAALGAAPATLDDLLPAVYADVEPQRLPIARGSLWAHLRKLADDGRAGTDGYDDMDGGRWWATPAPTGS